MKFPQPQKPGAETPSQRRRHGRVRSDDVPTTIGEVLDLSASGMRIRCGRKAPPVGATLDIGVRGVDGPFMLRAKVVWTARKGVLATEVGLEFDNPAPNVKADLALLARQSVAAPSIVSYREAA